MSTIERWSTRSLGNGDSTNRQAARHGKVLWWSAGPRRPPSLPLCRRSVLVLARGAFIWPDNNKQLKTNLEYRRRCRCRSPDAVGYLSTTRRRPRPARPAHRKMNGLNTWIRTSQSVSAAASLSQHSRELGGHFAGRGAVRGWIL